MQRSLPARRRHSPCFPGVVSILGGEQSSRAGRGQQEVSRVPSSIWAMLLLLLSYHEPSGKPAAPNGHTRTASLTPSLRRAPLWGPMAQFYMALITRCNVWSQLNTLAPFTRADAVTGHQP